MNQQLGHLIDLQNLDTKISSIEKDNDARKTSIKEWEIGYKERKEQFDILHREYKKKELEVNQVNEKIKMNDEKCKKLHGQRLQVTKPKEVAAIDREIFELRKEINMMEDSTLKLMEEVEELKNRYEEDEKKINEEIGKLDDKKVEDQQAVESSKDELSSFQNERKNLAAKIDRHLLDRYELIFQKKIGLAVAPLKKTSCSACHIELPPQTVNEVLRNDSIITCPSCSRFLFSSEY